MLDLLVKPVREVLNGSSIKHEFPIDSQDLRLVSQSVSNYLKCSPLLNSDSLWGSEYISVDTSVAIEKVCKMQRARSLMRG